MGARGRCGEFECQFCNTIIALQQNEYIDIGEWGMHIRVAKTMKTTQPEIQ
jgi:hypothetical protein